MNVADGMTISFKYPTEKRTICVSEAKKSSEICSAEDKVSVERNVECEVATFGFLRKTKKIVNRADIVILLMNGMETKHNKDSNVQCSAKQMRVHHHNCIIINRGEITRSLNPFFIYSIFSFFVFLRKRTCWQRVRVYCSYC